MSEEWHKTHAVLLKSVADAQGKLLAAQNELQGDICELHNQVFALSGQIKGLGDGLADEIGQIRSMFIDCAVSKGDLKDMEKRLMGAIVHKRASTKRKPRGRR